MRVIFLDIDGVLGGLPLPEAHIEWDLFDPIVAGLQE